jgi:hypothetical protein
MSVVMACSALLQDEIVNCATPDDWAGMFDVRDCASTPSGTTCPMHCAPGSKGRSTVFDCPANNIDPYFPSFGSYPNDCQGAPMSADPSEVNQLLAIKTAIDDPAALSTWVAGGDPCIYYWPGVGCDYLSGDITRFVLVPCLFSRVSRVFPTCLPWFPS